MTRREPAYKDNLSTLYITEALEGMSLLEPQSIHCAVTSPPFYGLRSYLDKDHPDKDRELGTEQSPDEYVEKLVAVFEALRPALRDDGTLWVNLGQSYCGYKGDNYGRTAGNLKSHAPTVQDVGKRWDVGTPQTTGFKPKDLIPVAWLFGIAMQRAGWYLRRDIIWNKPAAMPESVTDRPTTSHEYILMFSKKPRYYYDAEAVKEKASENKPWASTSNGGTKATITGNHSGPLGVAPESGTRNCRSVWTLSTAQYKGSHFAVFPLAIPDRIIRAATSERGVCGACGAPWRRVVEREGTWEKRKAAGASNGCKVIGHNASHGKGVSHDLDAKTRTVGWEPGCSCSEDLPASYKGSSFSRGKTGARDGGDRTQKGGRSEKVFKGWEPGCEHSVEPVPATVLDPFCGSGTTLLAARKLGRRSIGFDLDANSARHVGNRLGYQEVLC